MSLSFDGFWQSVVAYEAPMCIHCDERAAVDTHGCCSCCHWKVEAEVAEGWPLLESYLEKWAAFGDWELS
ncbi:MAG TPA: hypothetical protein VLD16_13935 [Gaiellaceae bacterium]|nr:hypothetical protein [Gaiellaceae bacterium]